MKQPLPIRPRSATSARGRLAHHADRLLAILYRDSDVLVLDLQSTTEVGRVADAGGEDCQEVLFDVGRHGNPGDLY